MSGSDLSKEALVHHYSRFGGIETVEKDWKRRAKIKGDSPERWLRLFENEKAGLKAFVWDDACEDADEFGVLDAGVLYYAVMEIPEQDRFQDEKFSLMFVPKAFWEREECFPDQHIGHYLELGWKVPGEVIEDEVSENTFIPNSRFSSVEEIRAVLDAVPDVEFGPEEVQKVGGY